MDEGQSAYPCGLMRALAIMIHRLGLESQSSSSVCGVIAVIAVRQAHGTRKDPLASDPA